MTKEEKNLLTNEYWSQLCDITPDNLRYLLNHIGDFDHDHDRNRE